MGELLSAGISLQHIVKSVKVLHAFTFLGPQVPLGYGGHRGQLEIVDMEDIVKMEDIVDMENMVDIVDMEDIDTKMVEDLADI